jgi:hypothetical protein
VTLRSTLNRLIKAVIEEADRNPNFEATLNDALGTVTFKRKLNEEAVVVAAPDSAEAKRGKNRRPPAGVDPVQVIRDGGELALRQALKERSLDQLRDIVAEFGMDPGRVVMKWKASARVIERIVEMSIARAHKGDAFRRLIDTPGGPIPNSGETGRTSD